ncbi:Indoleamine 2,3-dioxygenase [Basidiobolus meristosporus CBS 931.73]|uniref:Indoleamine 2,3-dioxygenase n=1 Tax=Basidiobolus meristosporus CBS 931.73 TaxID=1314790 RepID=A0A1Y1XTE8_9FUNG|nr:Indoleamine 2,3-dioxygenase [Basidiobolus meristosporus CBS 931.73]|eukprot:ORX89010.1 Indoleamine 2,3-dioxygenase [Basidiobolus meristosporus CBS 931.73]
MNRIPRLEDFGISTETGFLPPNGPLRRLLNPYYEPWEYIMDDLKELLLAGKLRQKILQLPILEISHLKTEAEQQRGFVILSMFTHGFIWGKNEPVSQVLPPCVAVPFTRLASILDMSPVLCNASIVIWNWRLLDRDGPLDLSNLAMMHTFTGSHDEAWFYLITAAIEAQGGRALTAVVNAMKAVVDNSPGKVVYWLQKLSETIQKLERILVQMYDKCDPYLFYWKIRTYLAGWKNMAEAGLPHGILYQGVDDVKPYADQEELYSRYRKYAGGSAGQSALIHSLDVALGVQHTATGDSKPGDAENTPLKKNRPVSFFAEMRQYMPGKHRRFLEALENAPSIRQYVQDMSVNGVGNPHEIDDFEQEELLEAFDGCLEQLKLFRNAHIQMVTRYIVIPAKKGQSGMTTPLNVGGAADAPKTTISTNLNKPSNTHGIARTVNKEDVVRGTGGTDLIPFLKTARDETTECKVGPTTTKSEAKDNDRQVPNSVRLGLIH